MRIGLLFYFLFYTVFLYAQDFHEYQYKQFKNGNDILSYRILYPLNFDSSQAYPVIVFLHGASAKGDDDEKQLNIGGEFFLNPDNRKNFPAIVIFPQCPQDDLWAYFTTELDSAGGLAIKWKFPFKKTPTLITSLVKKLLDNLLTHHYIDSARIYIGGLSQGGMGVWDMIARYPDLFAAAFPICGAGNIFTAKYFAGKVSVWIFHGEKDDIVSPVFSRDYYNKLKKLHADVRFNEYPGVFHNSWVNAFAEKELLPWLFSKKK